MADLEIAGEIYENITEIYIPSASGEGQEVFRLGGSSGGGGSPVFGIVNSGGDQEASAQWMQHELFQQYQYCIGISTAAGDASRAEATSVGVFTVAFAITPQIQRQWHLFYGWSDDHFQMRPIEKDGTQVGYDSADFVGSYFIWAWNEE